MVCYGVNRIIHFSIASIPPSSRYSINTFLQIILVENTRKCGRELKQFSPPNSSDDLCLLFCLFPYSMLQYMEKERPFIYQIRWTGKISYRSNQRIYISDRTHSTPQRLPNMCLTQPLPALSDSQVVGVVYSMYTTDRAGRGWVKHMLGRCSGMLCVLSLIYILLCT